MKIVERERGWEISHRWISVTNIFLCFLFKPFYRFPRDSATLLFPNEKRREDSRTYHRPLCSTVYVFVTLISRLFSLFVTQHISISIYLLSYFVYFIGNHNLFPMWKCDLCIPTANRCSTKITDPNLTIIKML